MCRAQHTAEGVKLDEVQAVTAALKLAAINFGESAGALDCHVIHIKGNTHIFSCYDVGRSGHVRMPGLELASSDLLPVAGRAAAVRLSQLTLILRCRSCSPSTQRCTRHR